MAATMTKIIKTHCPRPGTWTEAESSFVSIAVGESWLCMIGGGVSTNVVVVVVVVGGVVVGGERG